MIIQKIIQCVGLPDILEQDEAARRLTLLKLAMVVTLVYLLVSFPVSVMDKAMSTLIFWGMFALFWAILGLYFVLRPATIRWVGLAYLALVFMGFTMGPVMYGSVCTVATGAYLAVILIAGVLYDQRGIILSILASSLTVWLLTLVENAGLLPPPTIPGSFFQWFGYTALYILVGGFGFYIQHNQRKALLRTQAEINRREQVEEQLRSMAKEVEQSHAVYRLLAEKISDAIWILDVTSGRFRYVSPSVERLRGYTPAEVLEQTMEAALAPASLHLLQEQLPARIQAFQQGQCEIYVDEIEQPCKDGSLVATETTTNFQLNEANGHLEVYGVSRDITERKRSEAVLKLRLELMEYATGHSLDAFMQTALDKISAFSDSPIGFYHFVEPDQQTLSLQAWSTRTLTEFCHAEGKGAHYAIDAAGVWVDCVRQRRPVIHNDYASLSERRGLPPGHTPVVRELVVPVYRGDQLVSILGVGNKPTDYSERDCETVSYLADVVWEVVKRKQAEQTLSELQSRIQLLGQNLEDAGLFVFVRHANGERYFEYLSTGMEALTGVAVEDGLRDASLVFSTILPDYLPALLQAEAKSLADQQSLEVEFRLKNVSCGAERWMMLRATPRARTDGAMVWYGMQTDISERKHSHEMLEDTHQQLIARMKMIEELQDELREQSLRDPLTGLYNRRYLNESLACELARARRENKPLSIAIADIDHFKKINDSYGHQVGDQCLVEIAHMIKKNARSSDFIYRYGGEEFLLLLPGASEDAALRRMEELCRKCSEMQFPRTDEKLRITVSFGVAIFPVHGEQAEEIIQKADRALYQSKAAGRNCVTLFSE